jgi:hypothetical protein
MIAAILLTLVTATFRPAAPTVGDPIAIDFPAPVVLDKSPDFEIVSQRGAHVVVRTFEAKPFVLSGRMGDAAFTNLVVPVRSVLKEKDAMAPAPLIAPRREAFPRGVMIAIAIAVLLAAGLVIAVVKRKKKPIEVAAEVPPAERFRRIVMELRDDEDAPRRWARLADALRDYLAATDGVGRELTTSEVVARMQSEVVARALRHGDLEKFSPWGTSGDFGAVADEALRLVPEPVAEEKAA